MSPSRGLLIAFLVLALGLWLWGCATVPKSRYGVNSVDITGMGELDEDALKACLNTTARPRVDIELGVSGQPECGKPPFNAWRKHLRLWSWGFTDWPLFDRLAFERDKQLIERWYQARGYHDARVVGSSVEPTQALVTDTIDPNADDPGCERVGRGRRQGCTVRARFSVEEGEPTRISKLRVDGIEQLSAKVRREIEGALRIALGARFDEALYESSKEEIAALLREHGYARVEVSGEARVDRAKRTAEVHIQVNPGPVCVFGRVFVKGVPSYMEEVVRETTLIDPGDPFNLEAMKSAQRAVFSIGGISTATAESILPETGNVVDVRINVELARKYRYGLGTGIQAGIVNRGDTWDPVSVPQWDVHLIAKYTQHQLFEGARRLTVEDRPALIIQEPFPLASQPRFGNELRVEMRQYGMFEARTVMVVSSAYFWGPDPYDTFFRHRVDTGVSLERFFLRHERLYLSVGLRNSTYRVPEGEVATEGTPTDDMDGDDMDGDGMDDDGMDDEVMNTTTEPPADSTLTYLFQRIRLDYRDDVARPRKGFMAQVEVVEAGIEPLSSWTALRTTPDVRLYLPLPLYASFATRFAVGMLFIQKAASELDELSQKLGPRDSRLRGGGATSNRGWMPGELGDGSDGGTRRWEASAELRLRLTVNFGVVGFFDAGDVSKEPRFRWDHPQASSGFGLRYHTVVGPVRLDFAWRLKNLQVFGPDERDPGGEQNKVDFGFAKLAGAIHLTIGESF